MTGREVSEELEKVAGRNGPLLYLQTDNGPEFRSMALEEWIIRNNVKHIYSRPGKTDRQLFCGSVQQDSENGMPGSKLFS